MMKETVYHWIPSSQLGGIEMAALTLIQQTSQLTHVVATGDAFGPAIALWRSAGAEIAAIPAWRNPLGLEWLVHWRRFVGERGIKRIISWSPTRLSMLASPLSSDAVGLIHLGNVGVVSRRARLQDYLARVILRPSCRLRLIACSHAVLDSVSREPAFEGLSREMIYNPVRSQFFKVGEHRPKARENIKKWGIVARLARLKDHRTLIEAFGLLPSSSDMSLEIVGEGELEAELKAQVYASGLKHRIRFMGASSAPQDMLRSWDGFIFTTTKAEGFGIAVAEAMASGLPCVLSDVRAMREVAGDSAYYVPVGDPAALAEKIMAVANDFSAAVSMGQSARLRAASLYSPQVFARCYLAALGLEDMP